jgi:hypothetical protein
LRLVLKAFLQPLRVLEEQVVVLLAEGLGVLLLMVHIILVAGQAVTATHRQIVVMIWVQVEEEALLEEAMEQ